MDYLLLLSTIVLGAASVFLFKLYEPRHVKLLNAFTGAYLLCLTLLHLLPELYHPHNGALPPDDVRIGALILGGLALSPPGVPGVAATGISLILLILLVTLLVRFAVVDSDAFAVRVFDIRTGREIRRDPVFLDE